MGRGGVPRPGLIVAVSAKFTEPPAGIGTVGVKLNALEAAGVISTALSGVPPELATRVRAENVDGTVSVSDPEFTVIAEPELFFTTKLPALTFWPSPPLALDGVTVVTLAAGAGTVSVMLIVPGEVKIAGL